MKYNGYSANTAKKLYNIGKNAGSVAEIEEALAELGYFDPDSFEIAMLGNKNSEDLDFTEQDFYRIGEPEVDYGGQYRSSMNFASGKREDGVSIITAKWLHSLGAIFFAPSVEARGIYKIRGIVIGHGGDDEPVIYPTDWAEKTSMTSLEELENIL